MTTKTGFAKYLIERWRNRDPGWDDAHGLPIRAVEGQWYSTETGGDPPSIEIDWEKLQADIEQLEREFRAGGPAEDSGVPDA